MECQRYLKLAIPPLNGIPAFKIKVHKQRDASVSYISRRVGQDANGDTVFRVNRNFTPIPVDVSSMIDQRIIGKLKNSPTQAVVVVLYPSDPAIRAVARSRTHEWFIQRIQ